MNFEFSTAGRIVFGAGTLARIGPIALEMGNCAFVVTGRDPHRSKGLTDLLANQGLRWHSFPVCGEPTTEVVEEGARLAREAGCQLAIGIGGGSVIDAGKAVSALMNNPGPLDDYLEVIGKGVALQRRPAPYIAVPTTSGTGAEVTRNAVLTSPPHRLKVSLRSPLMLPAVAVVDPELTRSLSPEITAATGMDALTQLIEAYVSRKANPITDSLCRQGLRRCARSLQKAFREGEDLAARTDMSLASLFSGLALANGGLGAVHGIAGPLGGRLEIPHGVICGCLLPEVFETNVKILETSPVSPARGRFDEVARILTGSSSADAADAVRWLHRLARNLNLPSLSRYGLTSAELPLVAANALNASSMKGNPVDLNKSQIIAILESTLR